MRASFLFILTLIYVSISAQIYTDFSQTLADQSYGKNRGAAIGDFNGDGLEDIFISSLDARNMLYENLGDFQFEEVAEDYGIDADRSTNCALWLDIENDGDLDLFLANRFENSVLYIQEDGQFYDRTFQYGINVNVIPFSLNAVDFDLDGYLDIYIAVSGAENVLLKNNNGQYFSNSIGSTGITDTDISMAAVFFDYDNDGDDDLYQIHDAGVANLFFENNGDGTFTDVSGYSQTDFAGFGMGADVADLNQDGYLDIYITNLYENRLFINQKNGRFFEMAELLGLDDIGMGWGTICFDFDNDSDKDVYMVNDSHFGVNGMQNIPNVLYINQGSLNFEKAEMQENILNTNASYGTACGDFNNDGLLDLVITNEDNIGVQLFKNESEAGNYISINLSGDESNSMAIGARAECHLEGKMLLDQITCGSSYASQSSSKLHFGLGDSETIDSIIIHWPSGKRQCIKEPSINTQHNIDEPKNSINGNGQLVWTDPPFPTQMDDVTVYFDASEGNGGLQGFGGDVFAHTGVITSNSSHENDWQHVVGNWGQFDSRVLMDSEGNDIYSISYNINEFYGIDPGEEVYAMTFVFRNIDGSLSGRNADGSDIHTEVFQDSDQLNVTLFSPVDTELLLEGDSLFVNVVASQEVDFQLLDNGEVLEERASANSLEYWIKPAELGFHDLEILITHPDSSFSLTGGYYVLENDQIFMDPPSGIKNGLNYYSDSTLIFRLDAPNKDYAFFLCPENDFGIEGDYRMNLAHNQTSFWIELPKSIFENGQNMYQYLVDDQITIADPFSTVVLDPWNDSWVDPSHLIGLPEYPVDYTSGIVSVFDVDYDEYPWVVEDFDKPANRDLVIYEVLMRDFLDDHSYDSLLDTLDYLSELGINAIEFMPIQEFEGNDSWGYNPSYHMALDKYYGSRVDFKEFVDAAHQRGIAIILDVVYNHVFSQSPLAQLYWDPVNFRPSPDNPWLNVIARHPFNVGYDVNHQNGGARDWVKQTVEYWMEEYKIDGFRFDLSKGFTQTNSGSNVGLWSNYDASRISILKDYADFVWSVDNDAYVILEHFANNDEERELANYGMMIWGNATHDFAESAMGYSASLDWSDYKERGWNDPNLIAYMESHDEERMMYKIKRWGDSNGSYNTKETRTALRRVEAASCLYFSIPGPKMLWKFGELGYDFSINRCVDGSISENCRLDPKPIRWDYNEDADRKRLYKVMAALAHLKTNYATFSTDDYHFNDANLFLKTVHLNHPEMDAISLVNFRVTNTEINPKFQYPGTWYEYFTGDSLIVSNVNEKLPFHPGEYRLYTSEKIVNPEGVITSTKELADQYFDVHPNPLFAGETVEVILSDQMVKCSLMSMNGQIISLDLPSNNSIRLPEGITAGMYVIILESNSKIYRKKLLIIE